MISRSMACTALALAAVLAVPAKAADALVLVANADSPLVALDALAIRKAFVGVPVSVNGRPVRAVLNESEPGLQPAFLQHVVGTSELAYQRRVLRLTIQQGRPAPTTCRTVDQIVEQLRRDPYAVTYMWQHSAERLPQLRIVRILWRE